MGIQICKDISTSFANCYIKSSVVKAQPASKLLAGWNRWAIADQLCFVFTVPLTLAKGLKPKSGS